MADLSKTYRDKARCPNTKKQFVAMRRVSSIGRSVSTFCPHCRAMHKLLAGPVKENGRG